MTRRLTFTFMVLALLVGGGGSVWSKNLCGGVYAADPNALAKSLLPPFRKLSSSTPALSPKEEAWLDEELKGSAKRQQRAISSREYRLRFSKIHADSLYTHTRILTGDLRKEAPPPRASTWLLMAHSLIDFDTTHHLATLVAKGEIERSALPFEWTFLAGKYNKDIQFYNMLIAGRTGLAQHILTCILPQTTGIPLLE